MVDQASELLAGAELFGKFCVDANIGLVEQKIRDPHPMSCEEASKNVKACWQALRNKIRATVEEPFQKYAECLERTGNDLKECSQLEDDLKRAFGGEQ